MIKLPGLRNYVLLFLPAFITIETTEAQRHMENLDRGLIAIRKSVDSAYIGWRMLGTEPEDIAFNLYRQTGKGRPVKLNKVPIKERTNYEDGNINFSADNSYFVTPVINGSELEKSKSYTIKANAPVRQYINIPLRTPDGYAPNDVSAGDLDDDGEYELIVHQTGRSIDTPSTGISGIPVFQAYRMDGTFLWEISLGRNIREGEIIYGSKVVDDNGTGPFSTGFRHGDALHVTAHIPDRPGLQVFGIHEIESRTSGPGVAVYDARTGEVLFKGSMDRDVGRGVAGDIDPSNPGSEMWWSGSGGLYSMIGKRIGESPPSTNFLIWWDGDLTRELLDGNHIDKYRTGCIFTAEGCLSNNGSKSTPALSADLFGDWREEVIFRTSDNKNLRIYTTTIPTSHRIYTLMHDPQYRLAIATESVAYNQPPHTSFFLGTGMKKAPEPNIILVKTSNK